MERATAWRWTTDALGLVLVVALLAASQHIKGRHWTMTVVACTQCGRSEAFTSDPASLAALYPGSQIVTTTRLS